VPELSIVLPVRDGERYVREAIESLLTQTVRDFELVVVDDGSTDATVEIVGGTVDRRVQLVQQERLGLVEALNRGLAESSAPIVARMDADDISLPSRLERQIVALRPGVGLGGALRDLRLCKGRTEQAFEQDVAQGLIHYFIGGGRGPGGGSGTSSAIAQWVAQHFSATSVDGVTVYDLTQPAG